MGMFWKVHCTIALVFLLSLLGGCKDNRTGRGNDALRIGDYARAVSNFSAVLDDNPLDRDARYGLALSYYAIAEGKERIKAGSAPLWERTVQEFQVLWNVDSSFKIREAYSNSLFYLAKATLGENSRANVLPLLERSIALDSLNYFSFNLKALILESLDRTEEARNLYIYTITKEPQFLSAYINLGNLYWREGDVSSAWDIWSMGLKQDGQNATLLHWTRIAEDSLKSMIDAGTL
jgi:tetratricopeptide (TPR) repeat protein